MTRKMKAVIAAVAVGAALLVTGGAGAATVVDARPLACC